MASTKAFDSRSGSKFELESESYSNEVFFKLTCSEVESCLIEIPEKYQSLHNIYKDLKQIHVDDSEAHSELKK